MSSEEPYVCLPVSRVLRGPALSHLMVCGHHPVKAMLLVSCLPPHSRGWLTLPSGDTPGLAQLSLAWLPRLPFVSWSQHRHQRPSLQVSGTPEISWDWLRGGSAKPSFPSAAPFITV